MLLVGLIALGKTHQEAKEKAYANVKKIRFKGMRFRKEMGLVKRI